MKNLPAYRKTVAAIIGALITWGSVIVTSAASQITSSEWLLLAGSLATAIGVYAAPNETIK